MVNSKICRICNNDKGLNEYHQKKGTKDGHRNECKECVKEIQKKYKEKPGFKEKQKEYDKKRYNEKRNEILDYKKIYHKENKEKINSKKREYYKKEKVKISQKKWWNEYKELNKEKLKEYRRKNKRKNRDYSSNYRINNPHIIAWCSVLYSFHITNLFTVGMSWENHGEWHIDHIKPVSKFDKDTDVSIVCSLDNLQPLWATDSEIDGIIYEGNLNKSNN